MASYRVTYALRCGSMIEEFGFKKPTMSDVESFAKRNQPTNEEVMIVKGLKKVPSYTTSRVPTQPKRWLK